VELEVILIIASFLLRQYFIFCIIGTFFFVRIKIIAQLT
jgi:hypothetical protein